MDVLADLAPVSGEYARVPVADAFDWADSAGSLGIGEWYLVAFRSIRRPDADEVRLAHFDEQAHLEAVDASGFVHYYKGPAGADGACLSFCLWESRAHARAAAARPKHLEAVGLLHEMYAAYTLEFLRVTRAHDNAPLVFAPYDAAPPIDADLPVPTSPQAMPPLDAGPAPDFVPNALPT
ncbi:MAG TPA: hypothetical protein VD763_08000 [Candidatus Saccharimonadales bacterium]|nr:hypothetical protein [Candidatus Saccharimonadales bacterium]